MRTRYKGYADYGFKPGEEKELTKYCLNMEPEDHACLLDCAIAVNPQIHPVLYASLTMGLSYDKMAKFYYIPILKEDFYGYRRKCLWKFKERLSLDGKWK